MLRKMLLCHIVMCMSVLPVMAQDDPSETPDDVTFFEEEVVEGVKEPSADIISHERIRMRNVSTASDIVVQELGVAGVRRGGSAPEPVIRGLGYERVQTQIGSVPIYGGCPARMDPAATYIPNHAIRSIRILKGLPSVSEGPAGTAGRILVDTDYERDPDSEPELHGFVKGHGETARQGGSADAGVYGGNSLFDGSLSAGHSKLDDYESPDGVEVPARYEDFSVAASAGFRPREDHRWSNTFIYLDTTDVDYPSLPMDSIDSDFYFYQTGYRVRFEQGLLKQLEFEGGFARVDHFMDNRYKPNRGLLHAETPTDSDTVAGKLSGDFKLGESSILTTGMDVFSLNRDGTRRRAFVAGPSAGGVFYDRVWPDATQTDVGIFAEINTPISAMVNLRIGARGDLVASDAKAVDEPSLRMRSVRQNFIDFYGPDAGDVDQTEATASGNALLEWQATEKLSFFAGLGASSRSAGVTERFYAFAPTPGGFQIGNPTLDPEIKYEIDAGATWTHSKFEATISGFAAYIDDYINPTQIAYQDVNGDTVADVIRGYENIDASLVGAEASAVYNPMAHLRFPVSAMVVAGRNQSDDRPLPEIPPLDVRAAVVVYGGTRLPWWGEFGGRFVARQDRIDESFPENETAGFQAFHLRGGLTIAARLELELGVENLFNQDYNEHLTRESAFNYGNGLGAGDEIPEPERSFYLTMRYEF